MQLPHHLGLLHLDDRAQVHRGRRRHPVRLSGEAALAKEMVLTDHRDDGLFAGVRQHRKPDVPRTTYMTLVAGSPWVKICSPSSYPTRCACTPVQSITATGGGGAGSFSSSLLSLTRKFVSTCPAHAAHRRSAPFGAVSGIIEMTASVVSRSEAMDAAFCSAERTTLVGSITPAWTRFS